MPSSRRVTVFGAYGHTGRFVVKELRRRGATPILAGRDAAQLAAMRIAYPGLETRIASAEEPQLLDSAVAGSAAVINCAGPFADTAIPVIEASLRASVHYLDTAAEQRAVLTVFERFATAARDARVTVVPAMAFYGGLGDLMATAAMADWEAADEIAIAVALDGWRPTRGTRLTGARNPGPRYVYSNSKLERADVLPGRRWRFPEPFGDLAVVALPLAETITISRHLRAPEIGMFLNEAPLADLHDPDTPPPVPADESGRSSQRFVMDVIVRRGESERRLVAKGRDIYATTAPIVVEATERIVNGLARRTGVAAAGDAFDARDFLRALSPAHVEISE
jgi:uncharacterized protein YbjT (DUF2867 family)